MVWPFGAIEVCTLVCMHFIQAAKQRVLWLQCYDHRANHRGWRMLDPLSSGASHFFDHYWFLSLVMTQAFDSPFPVYRIVAHQKLIDLQLGMGTVGFYRTFPMAMLTTWFSLLLLHGREIPSCRSVRMGCMLLLISSGQGLVMSSASWLALALTCLRLLKGILKLMITSCFAERP